jgi:hypothetical protein
MENNVRAVFDSKDLVEGAEALTDRSIALASTLLGRAAPEHVARGGRKAHQLA